MFCSIVLLVALLSAQGVWTSHPYLDVYPNVPNSTTSLTFGLMLSVSGDHQSTGALAGVQAALDDINSRDDLLRGYSLHYTLTDSKCDRTAALYGLFTQLNKPPQPKVALVGSGCSSATVVTAEHAHFHGNITQISCTASSDELSDRVRFPYYFQLLPSEIHLASAFYSIIKEYSWRRAALIVQNEYRYRATVHKLMELLSQANVTFSETNFDDRSDLEQLIHPYDTQSRIYVLAVDSTSASYLICKAYGLGMTYPKYTFLTYGVYDSDWWKTESGYGDKCSPQDIATVLQYSLAVTQYHESNNTFYHSCYDAISILAHALNETIEDNSTSPDALMAEKEYLQNINYSGISGKVHFDENGIREANELNVLQYRRTHINGTPILSEGQSNLILVKVAYVGGDENLQFVEGSKGDIWPGSIPYDGTTRTKIVTVALPVTIVLTIFGILGIICALVCLIFNIVHRKKRLIRLNSPNLNYVMVAGAFMVYFGCIVFVLPAHDPKAAPAQCILRFWLLSVGHSLGFGSVIAKLLRIYYIFKYKNAGGTRKKVIHDRYLLAFVMGLAMIDVIILTTYTILEGALYDFTPGIEQNKEKSIAFEGELEVKTQYLIYTCSVNKWIRISTIGVINIYKGTLQICALGFAFYTRKVKIEGLNDAKYIAAFVYTTSIVLGMMFISSIALYSYINVHSVVYSFGAWLAISAVLGFMFVPKMVSLYKDPEGNKVFAAHDQALIDRTLTQSLREFEGSTQEVNTLQRRIRELEDELSSQSVERVTESFSQHTYHQCK